MSVDIAVGWSFPGGGTLVDHPTRCQVMQKQRDALEKLCDNLQKAPLLAHRLGQRCSQGWHPVVALKGLPGYPLNGGPWYLDNVGPTKQLGVSPLVSPLRLGGQIS